MTALNFPVSPSSGDVHNAANGLQYAFDGVKWTSQGAYDTGALNAQKLDSIAASFNGSTTTFNLKVNNATVKPHNEQSVSIVLNGHLQEPATAYTISTTNGTITFATAPASGTTFFGVLLSRIPITGGVMDGAVTNVKVAANAAIAGSKINPDFGSQNITTTGSITGTTTTQSAGDNTTKLASTAFVSTAIANLIDSSPETLNTLNELAAAINDDSDFHTTITNALAEKAPLASPTFTGTVSGISYSDLDNKPTIPSSVSQLSNDSGFITATLTNEQVQDIVGGMVTNNTETGITVTYDDAGDGTGKLNFATSNTNTTTQTFDDNVKAVFGTSGDGLEIYHDGSNSIIDDKGTGELIIYGSNIILQKHVSSGQTAERMADFAEDGAVRLYYDGVNTGTPANTVAVAKLETTASGISVSGNIVVSGSVDGRDLQTDGTKLDGIAANANNYSLPTATGSALGGVKVGSNLNIDSNGVLSAASSYSLPTASQSTLGGVKVGTNLTIDNNGVLSATQLSLTSSNINAVYGDTTQLILGAGTNDAALKLYYGTGSGTSYGVITADNGVHLQFDGANKLETTTNGIKINGGLQDKDGELGTNGQVLSSTGTELNWVNPSAYTLPTADGSTLGGIKVGTNLTIDNGVLSSTQLILTSSNISDVFGDSTQLILGAADGDGDDALKLYYGGQYGVLTADNGVRLQYDGVTKFQTTSSGIEFLDGLFLNNATNAGKDINWDQGNNHFEFFDNVAATFGTGNDLKIYHDGSNSYLSQDGTGDLFIKNTTGAALVKIVGSEGAKAELQLWADDGDDASDKWQLIVDPTNAEQFFQIAGLGDDGVWNSAFYAVPNGRSELLFDGVKKLETGTTYVRVTGDLSLNNDGHKILLGAGQDLQLWHDGSHSYLKNQTNYQYYLSTQHHFANKANNELQAKFGENASVDLYYDNSKKLETTSTGATVTGSLGIGISTPNVGLHQHVGTSGTNSHQFTNTTTGSSSTDGFILGLSGDEHVLLWNYENTPFRLATNSTERVRVTSDGKVGIGTTSPATTLDVNGTVTATSFSGDGSGLTNLPGSASDASAVNSFYPDNGNFILGTGSGSDTMKLYYDGTKGIITADNGVYLQHDGVAKFQTNSGGAEITGELGFGSGGTYQIKLSDNQKARFGSSNDLQIYHDGSNSYIKDTGTGTLILNSNQLNINNAANDEHLARFYQDGGAELYYDAVKRFETTSTGVKTLGDVSFRTSANSQTILYDESDGQLEFVDSVKATFGSGNDLQIYHNGSNARIINNTGDFYIGGIFIGLMNAALNEWKIKAFDNGAVELYYDHSKKLETINGGVLTHGNSYVNDDNKFIAGTGNDLQIYHSGGHSYIDNNTGSLRVRDAGGAEKFRVSGTGTYFNDAIFPQTNNAHNIGSADLRFVNLFLSNALDMGDGATAQFGNSDDLKIYHDGTHSYLTNTTGDLKITDTSAIILATNSLRLRNGASDETYIAADANSDVALYYDNSNKLETISSGVQVNGDLLSTSNVKVYDNYSFLAGSGNDLQISHNGADSTILNQTGNLRIRNSGEFQVTKSSTENMLIAKPDLATELYFDGSKKLETGSTYVRITGDLSMNNDNHRILLGASQDLEIYHDGTNNFIKANTGYIRYQGSAHYLNNADNSDNYIRCESDQVSLHYNGVEKCKTTSSGITVTGSVNTNDINMSNLNSTPNEVDNTQGSWTLQEGANDLFLINRVNGKKYKFNLIEI